MEEPKIVSRPAFTVAGMEYRGKNEHNEIFQMWNAFGPRMHTIPHVTKPHIAYGVNKSYDMSTGEFEYLAGLEVDSAADMPEGVVSWDLPAQKYAVFPCTLPTIGQAFGHICNTWLPQSGYQHAGSPEFELYNEAFDPNDPNSVLYLYIPIK